MDTGSRSPLLLIAVLVLAGAPAAFPQSAPRAKRERHIARIAGTVGGALAGLMVGWVVSDDDAIDATAKLTRNWIIGAAVGSVGGYFLGRTIDRRIAFDARRSPDEIRWAQATQAERLARSIKLVPRGSAGVAAETLPSAAAREPVDENAGGRGASGSYGKASATSSGGEPKIVSAMYCLPPER